MRFQISIVICTLLLAACGKNICLQGVGSVTKQARTVAAFKEIALYNRVNLIITQDSVESIEIEGGSHLLDGIETSFEKNVLTIADNNNCNWARDMDTRINVYLHTNQLQKIRYYGSGNVSSTNTLLADTFMIDSWEGVGSINLALNARRCDVSVRENNADITLKGASEDCVIYCAAQGKLDLRNFIAQHVLIDYRSIYDSYFYSVQTIDGDLRYKGNLYYRGSPYLILLRTHNSGQLLTIP